MPYSCFFEYNFERAEEHLCEYEMLCVYFAQHFCLSSAKDEVRCVVCDSPGDVLDQLFCCTCGQHYHGLCLDITVTPLKRTGWQCPECKVCLACK